LVRAGAVFTVLFYASQAPAQIVQGNSWPKPRLTVLTPTGGKAGTTFEVAYTGTDLDEPQGLYFSHPGITAEPVIPTAPAAAPQAEKDSMAKGKEKTKDKAKKPAPAPPPTTKFAVTISDDVPLGYYDVRFIGKNGISNPRVFVVGNLTEVAEKEPNNDI